MVLKYSTSNVSLLYWRLPSFIKFVGRFHISVLGIITRSCNLYILKYVHLFISSSGRDRARVSADIADRIFIRFATNRVKWLKEDFAFVDPHYTATSAPLMMVVLICNAPVGVVTVLFALPFISFAMKARTQNWRLQALEISRSGGA